MAHRVHITGAPGAGKTTIGQMVSERLGASHIDVDELAWEVTDPPYQKKTDLHYRREMLEEIVASRESWVISGSMHYWGNEFFDQCSLIVLLVTPPNIRLKRLESRERAKLGGRIEPGGDLYRVHKCFIEKAILYDLGAPTVRSLSRDKKWIEEYPGNSICVDGSMAPSSILKKIIGALDARHGVRVT